MVEIHSTIDHELHEAQLRPVGGVGIILVKAPGFSGDQSGKSALQQPIVQSKDFASLGHRVPQQREDDVNGIEDDAPGLERLGNSK
jgi:hypothetical protein